MLGPDKDYIKSRLFCKGGLIESIKQIYFIEPVLSLNFK